MSDVAYTVDTKAYLEIPLFSVYMLAVGTLPVKSFWTVRYYNFFLILLCSPSLHLFDPKYSKSSNIVKYFYYLK